MCGDIIDDLFAGHLSVSELFMRFGGITGFKVDLYGALMTKRFFAAVILELPAGNGCGDYYRLM